MARKTHISRSAALGNAPTPTNAYAAIKAVKDGQVVHVDLLNNSVTSSCTPDLRNVFLLWPTETLVLTVAAFRSFPIL